MDESNAPKPRRDNRSTVMMTASLEVSGISMPVKLRNLSAEGALVESDRLPVEGSALFFVKGDLKVAGRVAWVERRHAGVSFAKPLEKAQLMRHIPTPRPHTSARSGRPALHMKTISKAEKMFAERYLTRDRLDD